MDRIGFKNGFSPNNRIHVVLKDGLRQNKCIPRDPLSPRYCLAISDSSAAKKESHRVPPRRPFVGQSLLGLTCLQSPISLQITLKD